MIYPKSLPAPVRSLSDGMTRDPITGVEKSCAIHGMVESMIAFGNMSSFDSNHLSTSSSLAKQPQQCPNATSEVTSNVKNAIFRAKSIGRKSEELEIYFLLIKSMNSII